MDERIVCRFYSDGSEIARVHRGSFLVGMDNDNKGRISGDENKGKR